jgi:hypothetical protein
MYVYINTIGLHFDPTFNERDVTYKLRKEYDLSNVDGIGGIESIDMQLLSFVKFKVGDKELFTMFQLKYGKYIHKIIP